MPRYILDEEKQLKAALTASIEVLCLCFHWFDSKKYLCDFALHISLSNPTLSIQEPNNSQNNTITTISFNFRHCEGFTYRFTVALKPSSICTSVFSNSLLTSYSVLTLNLSIILLLFLSLLCLSHTHFLCLIVNNTLLHFQCSTIWRVCRRGR